MHNINPSGKECGKRRCPHIYNISEIVHLKVIIHLIFDCVKTQKWKSFNMGIKNGGQYKETWYLFFKKSKLTHEICVPNCSKGLIINVSIMSIWQQVSKDEFQLEFSFNRKCENSRDQPTTWFIFWMFLSTKQSHDMMTS